jgi:hypothetical protein
MRTKTTISNRVIRKHKIVKFQDKPSQVISVFSDDFRSSWYCPEALIKMRADAKRVAIDAHGDFRYRAWKSLFEKDENDISCEMLSMWTTNSNSLRGLERHVCASSYGRRRLTEHRERIQAVLQTQKEQKHKIMMKNDSYRVSEKESEAALELELATISRAYSHCSRIMAMKMGKADALAVSADIMKNNKMSYIRLMLQSKQFLHVSNQNIVTTP